MFAYFGLYIPGEFSFCHSPLPGPGMRRSWQSAYPLCLKSWAPSPAPHQLDLLIHTCNSSPWEVKVVKLEGLGFPWLYSEFGASLATQDLSQKEKMTYVLNHSFIILVLFIL